MEVVMLDWWLIIKLPFHFGYHFRQWAPVGKLL
jgi:hypothetical protein